MGSLFTGMKPLKSPSDRLHEQVASSIKEYILKERLADGDRLPSEHAMAATLGVSRASVREAVRTLAAVGIVEVKNGKGVFVRDFALGTIADHLPYGLEFGLDDVAELVEIRRLLEVYAIRKIALRATRADLEHMRVAVRQMQEKAERGEDFIEEDIRFHAAIANAANQRVLRMLLGGFWQLQSKIRTVCLEKTELRRRYEEHQAILDALESKDESAAVRALERHFDNLQEVVSGGLP